MGKRDKLLTEIERLKDLPSAADKRPELRFIRTISVNDAYPRVPGQCRRCEGPVPEGRSVWCSNACIQDALIRCSMSYAVGFIRRRDKGICAVCGLDTTKVVKAYKAERAAVKKPLTKKGRAELAKIDERYKEKGFRPGMRGWDADHIIPVVEGGGHCTLDNYRTLCVPCHKVSTKELAFRRRKKK